MQKSPMQKELAPDFGAAIGVLTVVAPLLFPGGVLPLEIAQGKSLLLAEALLESEAQFVAVFARRQGELGDDELEELGVLGRVVGVARQPSGHVSVVLQGITRVRADEILAIEPFVRARLSPVAQDTRRDEELSALGLSLRDATREALSHLEGVPQELSRRMMSLDEPGALADFLAGTMPLPPETRRQVLATLDAKERARLMLGLVMHKIEELKLSVRLSAHVSSEMGKSQRKFMLQRQRRAIEQELGEAGEEEGDELDELERRIAAAGLPEEAEQVARRQLARLRRGNPASPDHGIIRTYLEWIVDLPWAAVSEDAVELSQVRRVLDDDHHGLQKIKRRIVEFLAVRKLGKGLKAPILCLVGPPGVGKTSLGKSVARALGRKLQRVSLGGVHDEAAIRGHRRTYVGALPGSIIQAMRKAGTRNPVLLLDEVDKLGSDFRGDPTSALLEVLDPEQNSTFEDHYLDLPYDLSQVLFITTANSLDGLPAPLRDRMEIIEIPGYTRLEKLAIARRHLLPKQLDEHGVTAAQLSLSDEAIEAIIEGHTREAGVRSLERHLAAIARAVAVQLAQGNTEPVHVETGDDAARFLGPARFGLEVAERTEEAGVAAGLAWTSAGGELLFVEATRMPGQGKLILTGKLGEVMRESANAALSYVRANAERLGIAADFLDESDLHIHVPAGGVPKDGPSAGLPMLASLVSLLTGIRVRGDVAMTGEITLRGRLLAVAGIKEKLLAAHRAGIVRVVIPERNEPDLADVPADVLAGLDVVLANRMDAALDVVLEQRLTPRWPPRAAAAVTT
jgi:ATP-dependent Lon protease